jgi:5-methylcytosine-specific restriction endonuclease McrA
MEPPPRQQNKMTMTTNTPPPSPSCTWRQGSEDDDFGLYSTSCGKEFYWNCESTGRLGDDERFCLYCGKPILAVHEETPTEPDDEQ